MKDINEFLKQQAAGDWTGGLRSALIPYFGLQRADKVTRAILPGILKDFRKVLDKTLAGVTVCEEYTIDENGVVLALFGRKSITSAKITYYLDEVRVNGKTIPINDRPVGKAGIAI